MIFITLIGVSAVSILVGILIGNCQAKKTSDRECDRWKIALRHMQGLRVDAAKCAWHWRDKHDVVYNNYTHARDVAKYWCDAFTALCVQLKALGAAPPSEPYPQPAASSASPSDTPPDRPSTAP